MKKSSVSTNPKGSIKTLDVKKMLSYDNILSGWAIIFIIEQSVRESNPCFRRERAAS